MSRARQKTVTGFILEESGRLSLGDLSCACSVHAEHIVELVEEGVIEPVVRRDRRWEFTGESLVRARRAISLQRDLGLNVAGVALALDLLDELEDLRRRMHALESGR